MSKYVPFGHRVVHLVPFRAEGETASGIFISHHHKIPPVYGRVTEVHESCLNTRVGDWVTFLPGRPIRLKHSEGTTYAIDERQLLGVVEPGDGRPWFCTEEDRPTQLIAH